MSGALRSLYGYHAWANSELFDTLETLDEATQGEQRHTAIRLVNHYYVVARIFAAHLTRASHGYASDNTIETPDLIAMRKAVEASDRWYLDYVETVSSAELAEPIAFTFTDGDKGFMTREEMLFHVALHGGYHRGEIGRLLWQLSITPPWDTFAVYLHGADLSRRLQGGSLPTSSQAR